MRNKILSILVVVTFLTSLSFTTERGEVLSPNYDSLKVAIFSEDSPFYYPTLMERYNSGDTTLTLEDYHHLYYGFTFDIRYEPIKSNPYEDSLTMVLARNRDGENISPEIFDDVLRISRNLLLANPFNINVLNIVTYIYQMSGEEELAVENSIKMQMIIKTILNSGDGLRKESAWHVTSRADEGAILASLSAEVQKTSYADINVEYCRLVERRMGSKGLYFNIGRMWIKTPQERKKSEKRFELNPTLNPKSKRYIKPQF